MVTYLKYDTEFPILFSIINLTLFSMEAHYIRLWQKNENNKYNLYSINLFYRIFTANNPPEPPHFGTCPRNWGDAHKYALPPF